jgi:DNA-binding beta-propeller fold protein YncE
MKRILAATALAAVCLGAVGAAQLATVELPNGWRIIPPQGVAGTVGTLPTGLALAPDRAHLLVLETGHQPPALRILDAQTLVTQKTVKLTDAYGNLFPDESGVWIPDTQTFGEQITHVTYAGDVDRTISLPIPFFPSAVTRSPDRRTIAVAGDLSSDVALIDAATGAIRARVLVGRRPAALAYAPDGRTLYVALRAQSIVQAIDVAHGTIRATIHVGRHPDALAMSGDKLFVADSDDDDVASITLADNTVRRFPLPIRASAYGESPNALTIAGDRLYVSCGAANAVAVYGIVRGGLVPIGAMPTGWYPTAVVVDPAAHAIYIADGKGESGHANPEYKPNVPGAKGYIADNLVGSIRRVDVPTDAALHDGAITVRELMQHVALRDDPVIRPNGPLKHIIYVIKENRTYDQILGDVAGADGDPTLVMFGANITPNEHAIVAQFGVFDRFFDNAHVSADGHNWSLGAFANDYLEKMWPANYANRRPYYDFEDGAEASTAHAGYLFDDAVRAHVSIRNYGEFVTAGPANGLPVSTTHRSLQSVTDRQFPTFDLDIPDVDRFAEWKREFDRYEATNTLPSLEIVRFPRDHTSGTRPGQITPQGMVADNDRAVGLLVDAVSHSRDWDSTAIFVLEDDAQNGADHVDEQRSTLYVASPYARPGVHHVHYTTVSVLRTIEIVLGLPPLSTYDAGALPLYDAFTATPNRDPYNAVMEAYDVNTKNAKTAYAARESAQLDFTHEDRVPDGVLNDILWHAVRGDTPEPPVGDFARPTRAGATDDDH